MAGYETSSGSLPPARRGLARIAGAYWVRLALGAALIALAAAGARVLAAPSDATAPAGALQAGELVVTVDVAGAEGLAAFDATLRYDPAVVAVASVAPGDALPEGSTWIEPLPDGDDGVFFGSYVEGDGPSGRDGTLAVVTFTVLGPGSPAIRLDRSGSGAYDAAGAALVPPARMTLGGLAPPPIFLPIGHG